MASEYPGGSLSVADLLTYLDFEEMHIAPSLYATLAQRGYFPIEDLKTLRHVGSYL